jgi:hypothetical protein
LDDVEIAAWVHKLLAINLGKLIVPPEMYDPLVMSDEEWGETKALNPKWEYTMAVENLRRANALGLLKGDR